MSDLYSSGTSFEFMGDENSDVSGEVVTSSLLNQYEKPNGSSGDNNVDIQSLSNSITSDNELWTFYEKEPMKDTKESKVDKILKSLQKSDINSLRKLGLQKYGFVNDDLRRKVWPKLTKSEIIDTFPRPTLEKSGRVKYHDVIKADLPRTHVPSALDQGEAGTKTMRESLRRTIFRLMIRNPTYEYYQGYNMICRTFLLVLGEEMAFHVLDAVSKSHLHFLLEQTKKGDQIVELGQMYCLVAAEEEPKLAECEVLTVFPLLLLGFPVTWFNYAEEFKYPTLARLCDLFLVSDPLLPMYLIAAVILYKKDDIYENPDDPVEISKRFRNFFNDDEFPLEDLISNAYNLMSKHPPEKLNDLRIKRLKQLTNRRQRSAFNDFMNIVRKQSYWSIPVAICILALLYNNFLKGTNSS